jgi:2',3'-cyclic-nucleotide 2'-phosphodiesterase (5'-nucleotidase family)
MLRRFLLCSLFCNTLFADQDLKEIETVHLTILTFNDIYDVNQQNGYLGIAGLKTLLDREREKCQRYITTVNGDFLSPSIYSSVYKGKHMIDLFNLMEVDVVTFGNHEFDLGVDVLKDRIKDSNFIWLGTNVLDVNKGIPFANTESTVLFPINGVKFGLMGLTTTETANLSNTQKEIIFAPVILSAQAFVHKLKKGGADVVIALTHLNLAEDVALAKNVPEIDIILGGHDHEPISLIEGNTLIHKSGMDGRYLGRIDLTVEKKKVGERFKTTIYPSYQLIPNYGHASDPVIQAKINELKEFIEVKLSAQLGISSKAISTKEIRSKENEFANFISDNLRKIYNADVGIINSGALRGERDYPTSYWFTRNDILTELPFGNIAVLAEISGENLLNAIEFSLSKIDDRSGCFLHFSGLKLVYDAKSNPGHRVREVFIKGIPLDRTATYKVSTIDYLLRGGDGNIWFANAKTLINAGTGKLLVDIVCDSLKQTEVIDAVIEGRIVEISKNAEIKIIDSSDHKRIRLR